ncbi:unnamed protein product, partial [Rotaria magnacalcarata]
KPINVTVIQVYAPTTGAADEEIEDFYVSLQQLVDATPKKDTIVIMGDWNAKVGSKPITGITGNFGLGDRNEAGDRLLEFCHNNSLFITNTCFQQPKRRLYTWTSPNGQYKNQIDYILCSQRWRSSIHLAKTRPGADCGSDHELLVAKFQIKLKTTSKTARLARYNLSNIPRYATDLGRIFYGIPFAQPPLGSLRWNLPAPISRWAPATINATEIPPACPQPACDIHDILCPKTTSEDCLYLNIFTPLQNNSSLLPVMIFIPGGNFQFLDASLVIYEADRFVNTTNVVCIFIQYRLGVLGFLATGTGSNDFKGNYGILDQRLAIAWIKSNIDAFGGDPNQITLFGQSAGAQSTALHYLTSDMQSFFQAAIIQSHTCHGDELVFLFEAFWTNLTTNTDRYISTALTTYWTNYAKSKDPNQPVQIPLVWPKVTNQSEQYLYFQDPLQIKENYLKDDCDFWDEIGY